MTIAKPGVPLKFVTYGDDCPHDIACPTTKRIRIFAHGIKYKGKCYSTCKCGQIVLEVDTYQANKMIEDCCAELVNETVPLSEPGHECCDKHADDPAPVTPPIESVEPVAKAPDGPAVVSPTPVVKADSAAATTPAK